MIVNTLILLIKYLVIQRNDGGASRKILKGNLLWINNILKQTKEALKVADIGIAL